MMRKVLLTHMQRLFLIILLTFKKQPHVNTQTNLISLHSFKTIVYTHSDKKNHPLQTGIHTSLHTILKTRLSYLYRNMHKYLPTNNMDCTLQACNYSCVYTFRLNRDKTSITKLYNLQKS